MFDVRSAGGEGDRLRAGGDTKGSGHRGQMMSPECGEQGARLLAGQWTATANFGLQRVRIDARLPSEGGKIQNAGNFLQPVNGQRSAGIEVIEHIFAIIEAAFEVVTVGFVHTSHVHWRGSALR